jgi:hypothetical protein
MRLRQREAEIGEHVIMIPVKPPGLATQIAVTGDARIGQFVLSDAAALRTFDALQIDRSVTGLHSLA